jgi:DNA-directed RNA polymerase specialized sigma subunit
MKKIYENISEQELAEKPNDWIYLLKTRVGLLTGRDKILMTMYLQNGNTFYQMAKLAGVDESTIARRVHKIAKRLIDSEYIYCLRNRDRLNKKEMNIAGDYFLKGFSMKKIARRRRLTYYRVYITLCKIKSLAAGKRV